MRSKLLKPTLLLPSNSRLSKLASPLNAIAEATAEATVEALVADATEALDKVGTASAEAKSSASRVEPAAKIVAEAMREATGTNPSDTRSLCNAHPVKAVVATVDVKFETVGAPGADVEVALEAVAAELKSVGIVVAEAS